MLLLAVAAVHAYRIYQPFQVVVANHDLPVTMSIAGAVVAALLGILVLIEARR